MLVRHLGSPPASDLDQSHWGKAVDKRLGRVPDVISRCHSAGIEGIFHLPRGWKFDPWAGAGAGYEWTTIDSSSSLTGNSSSKGVNGFEFLTIQAGGDYRLGPHFAIGPFASLSLARYETITRESATSTRSVAISMQGNHEWLQLGARGTFGF